MNKLSRLICTAVMMALALGAGTFLSAKPPDVGPLPPLNYSPPQAERRSLKNGIVMYALENHELPLIYLSLKMKVSPGDEPKSRRGAMSMMGHVWRSGGTKSRTPEALNEELEFVAAHLETSAGEESATISLSCLTKDRDRVFPIFKDVLLNPVFAPSQIALAKATVLDSIRRKNDDPWTIGRRTFRDVVYGSDHYYAWDPTVESVGKIQRKNLVALHRAVVVPDQAILTVSGDFDINEIQLALNQLIGDWAPAGRHVPSYNYDLRHPSTHTLISVEKDLTQSVIYIGGGGISRHSPDQYAMALANYILGDGGASRLFAQVRSKLGLAYQVGSFYRSPQGPGLSGVVCQTKSASTVEAVEAMKNELKGLIQSPPTAEEMATAKDALLRSFIFRFNSLSQIAQEQADLEFFGFPADYLRNYPARIEELLPSDVSRVADKYFNPEKMKVVVIGSPDKMGRPLSELGNVEKIPLHSID